MYGAFGRREAEPAANLEKAETLSDVLITEEHIAALRRDSPTKIFLRCRSAYWESIFVAISEYVHSLTLDGCLITDEIVVLLSNSNCRQLKILNIPNNRITDSSMEQLKRLWGLQQLTLEGNPKVTAKGFVSLVRERGNHLQKLGMRLDHASRLEIPDYYLRDRGIDWVLNSFPSLTELNVASDSLQATGALRLATNYPRLSRLDIRSNDIGDEGAIALGHNLRQLVTLSVATNRISYDGVRALAGGMHSLKALDIKENPLSNEGVAVIARSFPYLLVLFIDDCEVGDQGVLELGKCLLNLEWIHLVKNSCSCRPLHRFGKDLRFLKNVRAGSQMSCSEARRRITVLLKDIQIS